MKEPVLYRNLYPWSAPPRIPAPPWSGEIALTDTTLRDGQQGWRNLSVEESLRIYEALAELAEGGTILTTELFPYTEKDREVARRIMEYGSEYPRPIGWIRSSRRDVDRAVDAGFEEVVMLASISDYHIYFKLGLSRQEAFEKYLDALNYAYTRGLRAKVTLEDITRADIEGCVIPFIRKVMALAEKWGEEPIIKLADTLGLGLPYESVPPPRGIPAVIRKIREATGLRPGQIEFHGHNDLGLVVANHLAAWLSGAGLSNCTLLGIGERAGNCPLDQMLIHYAGITGRGLESLRRLSRVAELLEELGISIPDYYPLLGRNAFTTKAGIHVDGLLKNPETYLPFDPRRVLGRGFYVSITPYSGRSAIALWIRNKLGKSIGGERVDKNHPLVVRLYEEVQKYCEEERLGRPLRDEELWMLLERAGFKPPQSNEERGVVSE